VNPSNIRDFSFLIEKKRALEEVEVPFGKIEGEEIIRLAWGEYPDRVIGQVKDGDTKSSIEYFVGRFADLSQKIEELKVRIEQAQNKGSFHMQLLHLKEQLPDHDGLGDYTKLEEDLLKQINLISDIIEQNRRKNTDIKTALLQELDAALELVSWNEASEKIKDIRSRWIKTGQAAEDVSDQLETDFKEKVDDFFDRRKAFFEDRSKLAQHHEKVYKEIIDEAKKLVVLSEQARSEKADSLKTRWKENGSVSSQVYQPLFQEFNRLLKARNTPGKDPKVELEEIISVIEKGNLDLKTMKSLQGRLKSVRVNDPSLRKRKGEAFHQLKLEMERSFLDQLLKKKFKNLDALSESEQKKKKIQILHELISRDKNELQLITINLDKFNSRDEKVLRMMQQKKLDQQRKIEIKESILQELKA
jgi:hypothetical protein